MKLNRKWLLAIALVLSMTMAISGTLAYLTDRDSEANVFTVGNVEIDLTEDFEQGATLIPGVGIEKKPYITNTGNNDAWVWLEVAIPSALDHWATDTEKGSNNNVIHWNQLGATTAGYVTKERVTNAIAAGHLPEDITFDKINSKNMTWNLGGKEAFSTQKEIEVNGEMVKYNCYVIGYNKPLTKDESTLTNIYKFTLDKRVDIDPDGNMFFVEDGKVKDLNWNINTDGNPVIYVSAYAMQKDGFATVDEAIRAYNNQWGDNGTEYGSSEGGEDLEMPATKWIDSADTSWYNPNETEYTISTAAELAGLSKLVNIDNVKFNGKTVKLTANVDLGAHLWSPIGQTGAGQFQGTFDGNNMTISNLFIDTTSVNSDTHASGLFGWLNTATVKNVKIDGAVIKANQYVGAVAGYMEAIPNCTITGCSVSNAKITAAHISDTNCGDKVGAVVGFAGNAGSVVSNCTASNCTVAAGRDAGQIAGAALNSVVTDCTATNVSVIAIDGCTGANINEALIGRIL